MNAGRQDAWTEEEDLMLAEIVLKNIREGKTQLKAFEEVGNKLERTSAACGFRWNATIRKKYDDAVKLAKQQKKENIDVEEDGNEIAAKPSSSFALQPIREQDLRLSDVIVYLKGLEKSETDVREMKEALAKEREEKNELISRVQQLQKELENLQHDYQSFLSLLDKARSWQWEKGS
ncbi:prespore-specific regulator [Geomicrobium halophilum]|uniref:Prespore-specific regulator n=1 Tax=Geomicrobium halophilum TaxID=549000 RepID=A0A841PKK6_9BACL|nr:RsfA family transcriptional regulator [Geomicrobium halophilum]MBB6449397.1 prespore-specific regulator [Geomicrobium halophilum]